MTNKELFKKTFDNVKADEEDYKLVLLLANKGRTKYYTRRKVVACFAAAVLIIVTAIVFVCGNINNNDLLEKVNQSNGISHVYHENGNEINNTLEPITFSEAKQIMEDSTYSEGTTANIDGYKVTIQKSLYDSYNKSGVVYFTIEKKNIINEVSLDNNEICSDNTIIFALESNSDIGHIERIDWENSTDDKLVVKAVFIGFDNSTPDVEIWLGRRYEKENYSDVVSLGSIRLLLKKSVISRNICDKKTNEEIVSISPIAISINIPKTVGIMESYYGMGIDSVSIEYKNGDIWCIKGETNDMSIGSYGVEGNKIEKYYINKLVDVDNLSNIYINGQSYGFEE